jgi:hypothetical protein
MSTLARINGEALSVPGLRFWGRQFDWKFSVCCGDGRGTVELWHSDHTPDLGGVEIHSPVSLYGDPEPHHTDCVLVPGDGRCWHDGTSLGYEREFLPLIRSGDSEGVLRELAAWHESHFGGES